MIKLRHEPPSLWAGILKEAIEDLWERWMWEGQSLGLVLAVPFAFLLFKI